MSKKILVIPDVHGIDTWEEPAYKAVHAGIDVIFLGDYCDSFDIDPIKILDNLKKIIKFKEKFPDKISLLLGNHDYAYVFSKYKPVATVGSESSPIFVTTPPAFISETILAIVGAGPSLYQPRVMVVVALHRPPAKTTDSPTPGYPIKWGSPSKAGVPYDIA